MGKIIKVDEEYFVEFYGNGLLFQKKAGKDRARAEQILAEIESTTPEGALDVPALDVEYSMFFETFIEHKEQIFMPKTFQRYKASVEHFQSFLKEYYSKMARLSEITPSVIEAYRHALIKEAKNAQPHVKNQMINFTLHLLRDILEYTITLGWLNDNPSLHMLMLDVNKEHIPITLTAEEVELLTNEGSDEMIVFVEFLLRTGVRYRELLELEWNKVDFKEMKLNLPRRTIPMDHRVMEIMQHMYRDQPDEKVFAHICSTSAELQVKFDALAQTVQLNKTLNESIFRNTFAQNLLIRGLTLIQLDKFMGFEDIAQAMYYEVFDKPREDLKFE